MDKKKNFLFKKLVNFYRYFKLKIITKIRKKRKKNNPLEDYHYPLW